MSHDKLQLHFRQQLSELLDGELAPDQARFLLRRLEHDTDLNASFERWQLCGEALRGRATAPAPAGFAERVSAAIAAGQARPVKAANDEARPAPVQARSRLARWGGGALAASVAAVALFMTRQQVPDAAPAVADPAPASLAQQPAQAGSPARTPVSPAPAGALAQEAQAVASAGAALALAATPRRASATRTQQAARASAVAAERLAPQRALASTRGVAGTREADAPAVSAQLAAALPAASGGVLAAASPADPFAATHLGQVQARPWPRTSLPQLAGDNRYAAGYAPGAQAPAGHEFGPFLPQVLAPQAPAMLPVPVLPGVLPADQP